MDSYQIADQIIKMFAEHEASWNGKKYTKGRLWTDMVEPFLTEQAKTSAFALVLKRFGWQYTNDVYDLCEVVKKHGQK